MKISEKLLAIAIEKVVSKIPQNYLANSQVHDELPETKPRNKNMMKFLNKLIEENELKD